MKCFLFIVLNLVVLFHSRAQTTHDSLITTGEKHVLYSKILSQTRAYWVHLPDDYFDSKYLPAQYPVIYLLDGDSNFNTFSAICDFLSAEPYGFMPKCIVVGILNTNRTLDLTPTKSSLTDYYDNNKLLFTDSGGNHKFIAFLQNELMVEVEKRYRTAPYKLLVGHSFGGLTAMNVLINHTDLFSAYLCIDPSLWWDQQIMCKQAEQQKDKNFGKRSVFIAQANMQVSTEDTTTDMTRAAERFHNTLKGGALAGLRWQWQFYPNEDHGSVPVPAAWDGLKYLFEGFQIPVKYVVNHPEQLLRQYEDLSEKLGFVFQPSEKLLDILGEYASSINKRDQAERFYRLMLEKYPTSRVAAQGIKRLDQ